MGSKATCGDLARDLGEGVADALVRAQVPQRRLTGPVARRQQPSVRGDGDLGHVRRRDVDRRLALAAGPRVQRQHGALPGPDEQPPRVRRERERPGFCGRVALEALGA